MTDLATALPGFPTHKFVRLLPSLEKNLVTTADLITLDVVEIAKRAQLPLLDLKRLCDAVLEALHVSLGVSDTIKEEEGGATLKKSGKDIANSWNTISTLDEELDRALGGGIPPGYITEVTGESGVGKTQFLLTLLLSAQLPAPHGLSTSTLYISTESALPTTRLSQLLRTHPLLISASPKPSLDAIISIVTPDLESQDHILRFQVPVAVRRHGIRLVILDSVAANYRAEFERPGSTWGQNGAANMAQRSAELVRLGQLLRDLAREQGCAIVVANQVADRFSASGNNPVLRRAMQSIPLAMGGAGAIPSSSGTPMSSVPAAAESGRDLGSNSIPFVASVSDPLSLDHQQRWFTGWGDDPHPSHLAMKNMKTPSLGLIWTTQIACRIALIKRPVYGLVVVAEEENERGEPVLKKWRRWMKVVFAPHVAASGPGLQGAVEFEVRGDGLVSKSSKDKEDDEALSS